MLITFFEAIHLIDIHLFLDLLRFIYSERATKIEIMFNLTALYTASGFVWCDRPFYLGASGEVGL